MALRCLWPVLNFWVCPISGPTHISALHLLYVSWSKAGFSLGQEDDEGGPAGFSTHVRWPQPIFAVDCGVQISCLNQTWDDWLKWQIVFRWFSTTNLQIQIIFPLKPPIYSCVLLIKIATFDTGGYPFPKPPTDRVVMQAFKAPESATQLFRAAQKRQDELRLRELRQASGNGYCFKGHRWNIRDRIGIQLGCRDNCSEYSEVWSGWVGDEFEASRFCSRLWDLFPFFPEKWVSKIHFVRTIFLP